MKVDTSYTSPNFGDRRGCEKPSMIILHYTGMPSAKEALGRLCDPAAEVSAHYVVDEDGTLYQLVDEDKRAWHAGVSAWGDITDINSHSIGIEIVNPGHEWGYRPFPPEQIAVVKDLCRDLMQRYSIAPENVLGHSDVAPGRKQDPGELFPWDEFEAEGLAKRPVS
jgi:N-acetylmuramoyl-L-alanine amidase